MEVAWWACGWTRLGKPNSNWEKRWSWGGGVSARAGASRRRLRSTRKPRTLAATTATPPTATPTASGMTAALLDCFWSGDDAFAGGGVAALLGSPGGRTAEFVTTLPPAPAVVLVAGFADDDGLELADAAGAVRDEAVAVILTVLVMVPVEDKVLVTVTARPTVLKGAVFPVRRTHARQHLPKKSTGGERGGGGLGLLARTVHREDVLAGLAVDVVLVAVAVPAALGAGALEDGQLGGRGLVEAVLRAVAVAVVGLHAAAAVVGGCRGRRRG